MEVGCLKYSLYCLCSFLRLRTDPTYNETFLMTYRSFTTLDTLFDLLVQRFWIQPPDGLKPPELEEWKKLKQHIIQMR